MSHLVEIQKLVLSYRVQFVIFVIAVYAELICPSFEENVLYRQEALNKGQPGAQICGSKMCTYRMYMKSVPEGTSNLTVPRGNNMRHLL